MTAGNSSAQAPAARRSGASRRGRIPCSMSPFALSTWPLACGCATDAISSRIFLSSQNSASSPMEKLLPLSVIILCGYPNLLITSSTNLLAVAPSQFVTGLASIHLVNLSIITKRWVYPEGAFLKGPTISSPQTAKGHVIGIVRSS